MIPWGSAPPQLLGPPKLFPVAFPYKWPVLAHASDFPKISQISSIWPWHAPYLLLSGPILTLAIASLGSHLDFTWTPLSPGQVAATYRSLCSSFWVVPGEAQAVADLGLYLTGGLRASTPNGQLQTTLKHHPTTATSNTLKGGLSRHLSSAGVRPALQGGILHCWSSMVVAATPCSHQPGGKSLPLMCQQQSRLNYNMRVYIANMEWHLECPAQMNRDVVSLDPTGHLLH